MAGRTERIPDPSNLITIPEAAKRYGVSTRTIYVWRDEGRLTFYKLGARSTRIDKVEADRGLIRRAKVSGEVMADA